MGARQQAGLDEGALPFVRGDVGGGGQDIAHLPPRDAVCEGGGELVGHVCKLRQGVYRPFANAQQALSPVGERL
jgi:hypothetical protein